MATSQRKDRLAARGKLSYQAPEMHADAEYDGFLTDAFSVGVTLYCAASQDYPWSGTKVGLCKCFDYFTTYGLRSLSARRRLRRPDPAQGLRFVLDVFDEKFFALVEGLVSLK